MKSTQFEFGEKVACLQFVFLSDYLKVVDRLLSAAFYTQSLSTVGNFYQVCDTRGGSKRLGEATVLFSVWAVAAAILMCGSGDTVSA